MEIVEKLRACFFGFSCQGDTRSRVGGAKSFVSTDLNLKIAFSLTWPVARQIYYNIRKCKQEKRGMVWDINMAAVLLVSDTNFVDLSSGAEGS